MLPQPPRSLFQELFRLTSKVQVLLINRLEYLEKVMRSMDRLIDMASGGRKLFVPTHYGVLELGNMQLNTSDRFLPPRQITLASHPSLRVPA